MFRSNFLAINHKIRNVQGDKTAYVGSKSTLQDNIWLRYDPKRDLPVQRQNRGNGAYGGTDSRGLQNKFFCK